MEMENNTGGESSAAQELAKMLETIPVKMKSLKLDHHTLVAKLEALMPFIETFAICTCELLQTGKTEEARKGTERYMEKFTEALDISVEDGRFFCTFLIMVTLMVRNICPLLKPSGEKKEWEEWFQGLWEKEG